MAVIGDILNVVHAFAPPELAEGYDNIGLLAGHPNWPVTRILCALDLTTAVVEEAQAVGAQLIVTHHPILFRGAKSLREDDTEGAAICALVRAKIGLIAAHTNFDAASPGVNDALAAALSLTDVQTGEHGMRLGALTQPTCIADFAAQVEQALDCKARLYAPRDMTISRVAVLGGAGGSFCDQALAMGAQAFVTGEVKHHEALAACGQGMCLIEAGHLETERVAVPLLAKQIESGCQANNINIDITTSRQQTFWRP